MEMSRYEKLHAVEKIKGYMVPRSNESKLDTFLRSQSECIAALERQIAVLRAIEPADISGPLHAVYKYKQ